MTRLFTYWLLLCACVIAQPELTNTEATNIDQASERQAWREALELWTDDSPTFAGGTYTGDVLISGKLNVGNGAIDDTHIVNFVSQEDVVTEVMLHLEWNSPTPLAGDSNALLFSMYDSALNETEYSRFRSVIEDPTDGAEDGAMTVDVLNDGVLEQAVLFSHDEIIMNDNGADRNFIVKDNTTAEVLRITGGTGSIAMDTDTLFVDSANNRVGIGDSSPSEALEVANGSVLISQANAQLKFAPRSAQNITQYIKSDASDLLYIGDTTAGKWIAFGDGFAGGMRVDSGGLNIGTGNNIEFDSNSGTWNGSLFAGNQSFSGWIDAGGGIDAATGAFAVDAGTGNTTVANDLIVDTDTLFVDSANNRVGVGTASPSHSLTLGAADQIAFTPQSAQNITQLIYTDVYDYLNVGVTTAGKGVYVAGTTFNASGITLASADTLSFASNSGTWNGATIAGAQTFDDDATISSKLILDTNGGSGTEGIIAFDDGFGSPTLILQTAGDIITFQDGNNNGSYDAFETVYLNYSIGGGVLGLGGTDPFNAAVSVGTNFLYMGSGLTIYNPFTVAGQVEMTGQSASTDDSAMTRSLVDTDRWLTSSRIWSPSYAFAFANSGTGSQALATAGELVAALDSGTSNSGYGKARLARGLNNAPGYSGSGIYFNREIGISINMALVAASTETNVFRIIAGTGSGAPAAADSDPITDDGFGVEVRYDGTNTEWRVFGHNGTTLTTSAWTNLYAGNRLHPQMFAVYSNGSGTITAYNTTYGGNSYATISTTGGPTTTGASATAYASAECANSSTGTTSTRCKIYDVKFFTP